VVAEPDPGPHEWHRSIGGWHAVFAALAVFTILLMLIDDGLGAGIWSGRRWFAIALLAVLVGWYALTGARAMHRDADEPGQRFGQRIGQGGWYIAVAAPLTIALLAVAPVGSLMLFALYPQIWALLPLRHAVVSTVGVVTATGVVILFWVDLRLDRALEWLVPTAVSLFLALALGVWITRIIEQSRQRAQLVAELAATRAELAAANHQAGVLAERERLAREIHDTLAQGLASVVLLLEAAEVAVGRDDAVARTHIDRARATARDNLAEARSLVEALSPPRLRDAPLVEALRDLADGAFVLTGTPRQLCPEADVALLRAAQEALTNARKHSGATRVEVSLDYADSAVTLQVADDGCGFDVAATPAGFGLTGMRERLALVGGTLTVRAAPAAGVVVRVELPA
jgi:signal transduction histidine kinase